MIKGEKYMNAREFTNQLEELVNHPAQKLVGNISVSKLRQFEVKFASSKMVFSSYPMFEKSA